MPPVLRFPDDHAAQDALTFAGRAAALGGDARVRLVAAAGVLVLSAAVLAPRGLLEPAPTILAMRMLPVDPELECDLVVLANELSERTADAAVTLPITSTRAAWAGVSPPRGGWEQTGAIAASRLASRAQWGMTAVAHALPTMPGEDIVQRTRAQIWGVSEEELGGLPRGVAFAAVSMGFVHGDEEAGVFATASWRRVSLRRGHVLVRMPAADTLGPVRATGQRG